MKINMDQLFAIILIALIIPYFYVSLASPIIFGDEGFHLFNAEWIAQNGEIPKFIQSWGTDVYKVALAYPPLFMITEAFAWSVGGEFFVKLLSPIFTLLTAVVLYMLSAKIGKKQVGIFAAAMLLTTPTTVLYGILEYTDALLVLLITLFVYATYNLFEAGRNKDLVFAGVFAGLACLVKPIGLLTIPIFLGYFILNKKRNFKHLLLFLIIPVLIVSPWILRNLYLFESFCYDPILGPKCVEQVFIQPPRIEGLEFEGRVGVGGVEGGVMEMGFLQFFDFAFGFSILIFFVLGLVFLLRSESKFKNLGIAWLAVFMLLFFTNVFPMFPFSLIRNAVLIYPRAEDTGRYILGAVPLMAMIAGIFISETLDKIKTVKHGALLTVVFLLFIVFITYSPFIQKAQISYQIKHFPQSWFDACSWVKTNTLKDALLYGVYGEQIAVTCDRTTAKGNPDNAEIQLTGNDTAYEHLKLHGFDYVFIPINQISSQAYEESYYIKFYQYVSSSSKFKLVFDDTGTYGQNGVQIYQIL